MNPLKLLPKCLLQEILIYTDPKTVCNFGQTCKENNKISKSNRIWNYFFKNDIGIQINRFFNIEEGKAITFFKNLNSKYVNCKELPIQFFATSEYSTLPFGDCPQPCIVSIEEKTIKIFMIFRNGSTKFTTLNEFELTAKSNNKEFTFCIKKIPTSIASVEGSKTETIIKCMHTFNNFLFFLSTGKNSSSDKKITIVNTNDNKIHDIIDISNKDNINEYDYLGHGSIDVSKYFIAFTKSNFMVNIYKINKEKKYDYYKSINFQEGMVFDIKIENNFLLASRYTTCLGWNINSKPSDNTLTLQDHTIHFSVPQHQIKNFSSCNNHWITLSDRVVCKFDKNKIYEENLDSTPSTTIFQVEKESVDRLDYIEVVEEPEMVFIGTQDGRVIGYDNRKNICFLNQKVSNFGIKYMKFIGVGLFLRFTDSKLAVLKFCEESTK